MSERAQSKKKKRGVPDSVSVATLIDIHQVVHLSRGLTTARYEVRAEGDGGEREDNTEENSKRGERTVATNKTGKEIKQKHDMRRF